MTTEYRDPDDSFRRRFELWRAQEDPPPEVLAVVEEWIPTRKIDPFRGARCQREEDDFWVARIPDSLHLGHLVICSYWVVRADRLVRCDLFGTLSWPA